MIFLLCCFFCDLYVFRTAIVVGYFCWKLCAVYLISENVYQWVWWIFDLFVFTFLLSDGLNYLMILFLLHFFFCSVICKCNFCKKKKQTKKNCLLIWISFHLANCHIISSKWRVEFDYVGRVVERSMYIKSRFSVWLLTAHFWVHSSARVVS